MLTVYTPSPSGLVAFAPVPGEVVPSDAAWIDLLNPQTSEVRRVEDMLGIQLPTREEMQEIEVSSRLYQEEGALFMTASVLSQSESEHPETTPVTFVLAGDRLVTVRHAEPRPFRAFALRAQRQPNYKRGEQILTGLLEAVIDRAADILEHVTTDVDSLSRQVFQYSGSIKEGVRNFQEVLRGVGQTGDLASKARESLMSIGRLLAFLSQGTTLGTGSGKGSSAKGTKDLRGQLKVMWRDVQSLLDHANFLAGKITLLLDATLGMINIEQNSIMKMFSLVSIVITPPTLISSLYGMNFEFMPELHWLYGYPVALVLMLLAAILPVMYFKRKGWL